MVVALNSFRWGRVLCGEKKIVCGKAQRIETAILYGFSNKKKKRWNVGTQLHQDILVTTTATHHIRGSF